LNYSLYISSYTASSEKQDGGPKTTFCEAEKKENIRFEKDNSTRKNSQKKFDMLAKYIYYVEISLNTSFLKN
jgi:hypothetical protein